MVGFFSIGLAPHHHQASEKTPRKRKSLCIVLGMICFLKLIAMRCYPSMEKYREGINLQLKRINPKDMDFLDGRLKMSTAKIGYL